MKRPYQVQHANNMPVQAPFYQSPTNPQFCPDIKSFTVYCRARPGIAAKYLAHTPFQPLGDDFILSFGDYRNNSAAAFFDISLVVPVEYKGQRGGYVLFEYEDLPSSVCGGRELWGYPKKVGDFRFEESAAQATVSLSREGQEIIRLELDLQQAPAHALPQTISHPHLLLLTLPRYGGPGIQSQKILRRDSSPEFIVKESREVAAQVKLNGYENLPIIEPLDEWQPLEVYGARYTWGDYASTDAHGYASLVDVIIADPDC